MPITFEILLWCMMPTAAVCAYHFGRIGMTWLMGDMEVERCQ